MVIERLLIAVELRGLFVEGIYRKSGALAQIRIVRRTIETTPSEEKLFPILNDHLSTFTDAESVALDDIPVHVVSTLVKAFFRELPEPLMTFDLYENFLNVSGISFKLNLLFFNSRNGRTNGTIALFISYC